MTGIAEAVGGRDKSTNGDWSLCDNRQLTDQETWAISAGAMGHKSDLEENRSLLAERVGYNKD